MGTAPLFEPGAVFENPCFVVGTVPFLFEAGVVFENHFFDSFVSFFPFELAMGGFAPPLNVAILTALAAVSRTLSGVSVSSPLCATSRATARMATENSLRWSVVCPGEMASDHTLCDRIQIYVTQRDRGRNGVKIARRWPPFVQTAGAKREGQTFTHRVQLRVIFCAGVVAGGGRFDRQNVDSAQAPK